MLNRISHCFSKSRFCLWAVAFGCAALLPRSQCAEPKDLPPARQITSGPKFHWFGYYDKFQFSTDNHLVLGNEVDFEGRSPKADDTIRVGVVDLRDTNRWI